jgi:predicted ATPase
VLIPLVARAGVLAEVDSALTAARAGRGTLLAVTGEPGIGKTRLAEEAAGRADGFEVVWTWGPAAAGGAALGPWSRVLLAASVLGTRFRRDVLAGLVGTLFDIGHGELAAALAAGRDARLLELAGPGEDRFRHDLVRDAIYDAIPVAAREDLHARAGDVLAALAGRGRDVDDAEVAYHLARAGTAAAGPAAEYARRAGDRALAALAFEDAVHWYERAAASLTALRAGDDEQACAALRLGAARLAAGTWTADEQGSGTRPSAPAAPDARTCSPARGSASAAARPDSRSGCSTASRSACSKRPGPAFRTGTAR